MLFKLFKNIPFSKLQSFRLSQYLDVAHLEHLPSLLLPPGGDYGPKSLDQKGPKDLECFGLDDGKEVLVRERV